MDTEHLEVSLEKCECAEAILKEGHLEMRHETFSQMIDEEKLINISGSKLNEIMQNEFFDIRERKKIRKMRRILINRGTAKKSGLRKKTEFDVLEREVTELTGLRQMLRIEKINLQKEINEMTVAFIGGSLRDRL